MNRDTFEQHVLVELREVRKDVAILREGLAGLKMKVAAIAMGAGTVASLLVALLKG